jgi:hypothetical protein
VERIVGVGRQLIAAKEACEHGEFARLFKGHANVVQEPVPFTLNTAERLMRVARHPVLSNPAHMQSLPQSWGTLYELSQLDHDTLAAGIKAGEITPEMTRSQAAELRADPVERPELAVHEAMADAVKNAVTKFIGQLTTPAQFAYVLSRLDRLSRFICDKQTEVAVTAIAAPPASIEPVAVEMFDAMTAAVRADCLDAEHSQALHEHWMRLGEPLFSDFPFCRVRAPWIEDRASDAIRDAAAFAAGVQGRPAKVFRQLNAVGRRIVRLIEPRCAVDSPS